MARHEIFVADIRIQLPDSSLIKKQLSKIESEVLTSMNRIGSGGFDMPEVDFGIGERGGVSDLPIKKLRQLRGAIKTELEAIGKDLSSPDILGSLDTVTNRFGTTTEQVVAQFAKMNDRAASEWKDFADIGIKEAKRLADTVVTHSIIPDMVDAIGDSFAEMPEESRLQIKKLEDQFRKLSRVVEGDLSRALDEETQKLKGLENELAQLRNEFITFGKSLGAVYNRQIAESKKATVAQDEMGDAAKRAASESKAAAIEQEKIAERMATNTLKNSQQYIKAIALTDKLNSSFRSLGQKGSESFIKLKREFKELEVQLRSVKDVGGLDDVMSGLKIAEGRVGTEATRQIDEYMGQIDELRKRTDLSGRSVMRTVQDIGTGIQVAFGEGSNKAVALRTALFGVGEPATKLGRTFDLVLGKVQDLNIFSRFAATEQDRLSGAMSRTASEMAESGAALQGQIATLKNIVSLEGQNTKELTKFDNQMRRLRQSYKDIEVAALSRGKVGRTVERAQVEAVRELEAEYQNLIDRGIIQVGTKSDEVFRGIIADARQSEHAVALLRTQQDKLAASIEKGGQAAKKTISIFGNLIRKITFLPKIFTSANTRATALNTSMLAMKAPVGAATKSFSIFGQVLAGVLGGNLLFVALDRLGDFMRRIPSMIFQMGSDAEENLSKFHAVFKEAADGTIVELEKMAQELGRSKFEFIEYASTLQDTFVPLGFSRQIAADMSTTLTQLTVDLASFNNKAEPDVLRDLQSAIVGNHETLRKYGIIITQSVLDQELLSQGFEGGARNATEQQKVMARLGIIMKSTTDAQGDAQRTAEGWANQTRALKSQLTDMGTELSTTILPAIAPFLRIMVTLVRQVAPAAIAGFERLRDAIIPFATALADALSEGNVDAAFDLFLGAIGNGVNNVLSFLNEFIPSAANWGINFVSEIATGIYDAASTILIEAVNYVGEIISSFLEPGSPPDQGPLSTIDKWGKGLVDTFSLGFKATDFSFIKSALAPIKKHFIDEFGEGGFEPFKGVREKMVQIVSELNATGQINQGLFDDIAKSIGEGNTELTKFLKTQLNFQKAQKDLEKIQNEIAKAEKAGFVPKELRDKLRAAEKQVEATKEQVDWQKEFLDFQELSRGEFTKTAVAAAGINRAAAAGISGAKKTIEAVKKSVNKQVEFIQSGYAEEKRLLDLKLADGAISREEYLRKIISLEKKYIDASYETGELSSVQKHINDLRDYESQLKSLKGDKSISGIDMPSPEDIFGDYGTGGAEDVGEGLGEKLMDGLKLAIATKMAEIRAEFTVNLNKTIGELKQSGLEKAGEIGAKLTGPFKAISETIIDIVDRFKSFTAAAGLLSSPLLILLTRARGAGKALGPLGKIFAKIAPYLARAGTLFETIALHALEFAGVVSKNLLPMLRVGAKVFIRFAGTAAVIAAAIAALIYGIWTNKELLVEIFDDFVAVAGDMAGRFIEAISPIIGIVMAIFGIGVDESMPSIISDAIQLVKDVVMSTLPSIQQAFEGAFNFIYGVIKVTLLPAFDLIIATIALLTGNTELAKESLLKAWGNIKDGLGRIGEGIMDFLGGLATLFVNVPGTLAEGVLKMLGLDDEANTLAKITDTMSRILTQSFELIGDIIGDLTSGEINLSEAGKRFAGVISTVFTFVSGPLAKTWVKFRDSLLNKLAEKITEAIQALGPLANKFGSWISEKLLDALNATLVFLTQTVPKWVISLGSKLAEWTATAIQYVSDNWQSWAQSIGYAIGLMIGGVISFVSESVSYWTALLYEKFSEWLSSTFGQVEEDETSFGERLGEFIGNVIGGIFTFITITMPTWIYELGVSFGKLIAGLLTYIEENKETWKQDIANGVVAIIAGMLEFLLVTLPEWQEELNTLVEDLVASGAAWITENGPTLIEDLGNALVSLFWGALDFFFIKIPEFQAGLGEMFSEVLSGVAAGLGETGPEWLTGMSNVGEEAVAQVSEGAQSATEDFENSMSGMETAIAAPVEQGTSAAVASFDGMADEIYRHSIVPDMVAGVINEFGLMVAGIKTKLDTMPLLAKESIVQFKKIWDEELLTIRSIIDAILGVKDATDIDDIIEQMSIPASAIVSVFESAIASVVLIFDDFSGHVDGIIFNLVRIIGSLSSAFARIGNSIKNTFSKLKDASKNIGKVDGGLSDLDDISLSGITSEIEALADMLWDAADAAADLLDSILGIIENQDLVDPDPTNATSAKELSKAIATANSFSKLNTIATNAKYTTNNEAQIHSPVTINANFPNVTSAREADGITEALNSLVARSRNLAAIGG